MKSKGVVYYNLGRKCLSRLAVSIYTLRQVYDGPITLLQDQKVERRWILDYCKEMNVDVVYIDDVQQGAALVRKTQLWKYSPYDVTLFIDSDTVVLKDPSPAFKIIEKYKFVTVHFAEWKTSGGTMAKRIKAWEPVIGKAEVKRALAYGKAVNTGVIGWTADASILPEWDRITVDGCEKNCTRRIIDEVACQVLLHKHKHKLLDYRWNTSVKHGPQDDPIIVHYHGYKHAHDFPICELWKNAFWATIRNTKHGHNANEATGDKRLKRYIETKRRKDLTIVTAVNRKYADKFISNYNKWRETPGLREQPMIVFYHPDCIDYIKSHPDWKLKQKRIRDYHDTKFIKWEFPKAEGNVREEMLSAFIIGTAKHVTTKYFMKLDGDCTPVANFEFPDYTKYTAVGHKWSFTKIKGDPGATRHWLNTLDDFCDKFTTTPHLFNREFDMETEKRVRHKRFCSFCYIEETAFTRLMSALFDEHSNGRLPVPTQDTTAWFILTRFQRPVLLTNFKKFLKP